MQPFFKTPGFTAGISIHINTYREILWSRLETGCVWNGHHQNNYMAYYLLRESNSTYYPCGVAIMANIKTETTCRQHQISATNQCTSLTVSEFLLETETGQSRHHL